MIKVHAKKHGAIVLILVLISLAIWFRHSAASWCGDALVFSNSHPAIVLVLVGVAGEGSGILLKIFKKKFHDAHEHGIELFEALCWMVVVVGLALEIPDAAKSDRAAKEAKDRAAANALVAKQLEIKLDETKTELANAESRLIELRNQTAPMNIGEQMSFANALKPLAGIQVEMRSVLDPKAESTADELSYTFSSAGWQVVNRSEIWDSRYDGILIGLNGDASSRKAANLLLKVLTERAVPSRIDIFGTIRVAPTNTILVLVGNLPSPAWSKEIIALAQDKVLSEEHSINSDRMSALQTMQFPPNSQALTNAQNEYSKLMERNAEIDHQRSDFDRKMDEINNEIRAESGVTNAPQRGMYEYHGHFISGRPVE